MPTTTAAATYKLIQAKSPVIDLSAVWHILLVSLAAGAGLAIAFGLILLGGEFFEEGKDGARKAGGIALGIVAAAFCVGVIVVGIHTMVNPPKSKPLKVVPTAAVTSPG
jgi:hypothetical protein